MPRQLTIRLLDGTSFEIDQDEWHRLASPVKASLVTDESESLIIDKHDDGRTLIYAEIKRPDAETIVSGELLSPKSTDVEGAVMRVARTHGLTEYVVEGCLKGLRSESGR